MSSVVCTSSTAPVDPDVHRRIRLRRLGVRGAIASVVAELAFGTPRNAIVVVTFVPAATAEVRQ